MVEIQPMRYIMYIYYIIQFSSSSSSSYNHVSPVQRAILPIDKSLTKQHFFVQRKDILCLL